MDFERKQRRGEKIPCIFRQKTCSHSGRFTIIEHYSRADRTAGAARHGVQSEPFLLAIRPGCNSFQDKIDEPGFVLPLLSKLGGVKIVPVKDLLQ